MCDEECDTDAEHEPRPERELAASFGRCCGHGREDRDTNRKGQRVTPLPENPPDVRESDALENDRHDDRCQEETDKHRDMTTLRPRDGQEEEEPDASGPEEVGEHGRWR